MNFLEIRPIRKETAGLDLLQQLQHLVVESSPGIVGQTRYVSAWTRKALDQSPFDRIAAAGHDNRDRCRRLLSGQRGEGRFHHERVHRKRHQFCAVAASWLG